MTQNFIQNITSTLIATSLLWGCAPKAKHSSNSAMADAKAQIPSKSHADWKLVPEESGMTYITLKNRDLAEINTFREIEGTVTPAGHAEIIIDLNSVDTNNEVRDDRLKSLLFQTDSYPKAKISSVIDMVKLEQLAIGESQTLLLDMNISLHSASLQRDFYVLATRLEKDKVVVTNKAPLILHAQDFGFMSAIEELRNLASLDEITPIVTATVSFVFER
ncbi:MAG: YceI family protein [Hellea sp.]